MERGYKDKMMRKQIWKAWEYSRNDLLEREKPQMNEPKLAFNITYHPANQNVRAIMEELQILLAPPKVHKKVFTNVSVIGCNITHFWSDRKIWTIKEKNLFGLWLYEYYYDLYNRSLPGSF